MKRKADGDRTKKTHIVVVVVATDAATAIIIIKLHCNFKSIRHSFVIDINVQSGEETKNRDTFRAHDQTWKKYSFFRVEERHLFIFLLLFFGRASLLLLFLLKSVKWRTNLLITFHRKISPCNLTFAHHIRSKRFAHRKAERDRTRLCEGDSDSSKLF